MTEPPAPDTFLGTLIQNWSAVLAAIDPADRAELIDLVRGTDPLPHRQAAVESLLFSRIPPEHPLWTTLFGSDVRVRWAAGVQDRGRWQRLGELAAGTGTGASPLSPPAASPEPEPEPGPEPEPEPEPGTPTVASRQELHRRVRDRLARYPWLTPDQVEPSGPGSGPVIRLRYGPDDVRLPQFQFTRTGRPLPVVTQVNELLGAAHDPWGVACWWVGRHRWLRAAPVDLLGHRDTDLLDAARSVLED